LTSTKTLGAGSSFIFIWFKYNVNASPISENTSNSDWACKGFNAPVAKARQAKIEKRMSEIFEKGKVQLDDGRTISRQNEDKKEGDSDWNPLDSAVAGKVVA